MARSPAGLALSAVVGFQEESRGASSEAAASEKDVAKVKVEDMGLSARVTSALVEAGIKTAAGLARKSAASLNEIDGIGDKAVTEITEALAIYGLSLKGE